MTQARKTAALATATRRVDGPRVGRVVAFARGVVRVEVDGTPGSVVARASAALDDAALEQAARERQDALLLFEDGDPARPLLLALLRSATPLVDAALAAPLTARKTARVDGDRVEVEGHEEVVLRCGRASLTLRRDGTVVLRGVTVVSQADGVQRIRGGKVQIN